MPILRSVVLVLGLLGAGLGGFLGFKAYSNVHDPSQRKSFERAQALLKEAEKANVQDAHVQTLREEVDRIERLGRVCYVMLAASLLGIAGGVLALLRRGKVAAGLMLLPAAVAGVLYVPALIGTAPLILGGLLSLLVRSRPRLQPA